MPTIRYTSGADLLIKLILMALVGLSVLVLGAFIAPAVDLLTSQLPEDWQQSLPFLFALAIVFCIIAILPGDWDDNIGTISTMLYARTNLGVLLRWDEAREFSAMFSGYETWFPMKELTKLPRSERKNAIRAHCEKAGRLLAPQSQKHRNSEALRRKLVLFFAPLTWTGTIWFGAVYQRAISNWHGFIVMGVVPTLFIWIIAGVAGMFFRRTTGEGQQAVLSTGK